ncbi:endonuclease MutS2 [Oceanivirga miroungae]|uniref:Endonuclease MutS2 n=1 Tax=Oceanivirga miroungae TaxID=1130046 RepID=A0A6I8MDB2_9FUSO|nr:endonuclease MutS2 [Oceanivirga miroungae]VWL85494.1 MutS2 family protein [Oceanivirga miroungae]
MKSYEDILEFYKIKNELVDFSYFNETKEKFIDLQIYNKKEDLEYELSLLQDLIDFYKYDGGFNIEEIKDINHELKKLEILGSYLEAIDLLNIRINLAIYRKSQNRAKAVKEKYKKINDIFSLNIDTREMEKVIDEIIDEKANIKDEANSNILDIRRQKKIINQNIKEKIENIFNDPNLQNAIDNKIITTRNDRYVINIKSDFKGLIKGIEHDRSSSGNSVFIEPLSIVSLNNKMREYESREREEIRRLLIRLSEYLRKNRDDIKNVFETIKNLDFLNAKVLFSNKYECNIAKIAQKPILNIVDARHPLLDKNKVVPLSFSLLEDQRIMLITGPNTGGKTVTLKVAGLLTLMTLSGLSIPASDKTVIGMFDNVLADIGDEQSIEQNLSSFSSHVRSISHLVDVCTSKSLVLLDELGSGTDPTEGSAFAMAIIDYLRDKKVFGIITTHYSEVKAHAFESENIKSASMEFDVATLSPTYRLIEGIPGESNALIIAKNYGISDEIIKNAKSYISDDNKRVEKMILAIKSQNDILEKKNKEIEDLKLELEDKKKELDYEISNLKMQKEKIIEESIQKADEYIRQMQNKAKSLIDKINKEESNKENIKDAQRNINMLYDSIREDKKKIKDKTKLNKEKIDFKVGEEVYVKTINQNAIIINIVENKNSVQIQAGILKLLVPIAEIKKIDKKNVAKKRGSISYKASGTKHEIDVRGKYAEDAIHEIEAFLDKATLGGYHSVYIIHGKGTMVLRSKIREYLKESAYVNDFFDANETEGGKGCTIVNLK